MSISRPVHSSGFVLLIAPSGSYRIAPYLRATQALDLNILIVSNSANSLVPEVAQGITVDFDEQEKAREIILSEIKGRRILCVLATDDSCVNLSSQIALALKLPHNRPDATQLTQRKDLGRKALKLGNCNTPGFCVIDVHSPMQTVLPVSYPVVLKPLSLSASKGVIRADNDEQLATARQRIDTILQQSGQTGFTRDNILVESYLDGPEYAIEGFIIDGQFHLLTIFDKPEPLTGPHFEETYYLTPSQLDAKAQSELLQEVSKACAAYGLEHGPVHAEARITGSGPVLLELAARTIGGQCGQLIEFSLQQKLEELVINGMCGQIPEFGSRALSAGVLMIPVTSSGLLKRVEGLTAAMQVEFIIDVEIHIQPGYELIPLPEGSSYLGFIFAQAPTYEQTYQALRLAHQKLRFVTQPLWRLNQH